MRSVAGCVYDVLRYVKPSLVASLDGMKFSTQDVDNDILYGRSCGVIAGGGWWHNKCGAFVPTSTTLTPSWYCPTTDSWWSIKNIHLMVKSQ